MARYVCTVCGYVYDKEAGIPEQDIAPGTKWEELVDFTCPLCGAGPDLFEKE
jgi:rubredoxin